MIDPQNDPFFCVFIIFFFLTRGTLLKKRFEDNYFLTGDIIFNKYVFLFSVPFNFPSDKQYSNNIDNG